MDERVKQAMAKWPNVPHCYGWLALDAQGKFRMRDEAAQAAHLLGDVIRHASLLNFIYQNYESDTRGAWYFQNGPQRVYVELETTPFIVHTDPEQGFVLHDRTPVHEIDQIFMTNDGRLIVQANQKTAMLDNRDLAHCVPLLRMEGLSVADDDMLNWLSEPKQLLQIELRDELKTVEWIDSHHLQSRFGFIAHPSKLDITSAQ
jgi:hypothetical protein